MHQSNISKDAELTLHGRITVQKNGRAFRLLVTAEIWDDELVKRYCPLGYILLQKDERKKALKAGHEPGPSTLSNTQEQRGFFLSLDFRNWFDPSRIVRMAIESTSLSTDEEARY